MTDYALGKETFKVVTGDVVTVFITSNITSFTSEKRMDKSITVADLKSKLELICGASAGAMTITVFDKEDRQVCSLQVCGGGLFLHPSMYWDSRVYERIVSRMTMQYLVRTMWMMG